MLGYWCFCYIIETNGFYYFVIFIMYGRLLGFFSLTNQQSVSQTVCLSVVLPVCLSVGLSVCQSGRDSQTCWAVTLSSQPVRESVSWTVNLSRGFFRLSARQSVSHSVSPSVSHSVGSLVDGSVNHALVCNKIEMQKDPPSHSIKCKADHINNSPCWTS